MALFDAFSAAPGQQAAADQANAIQQGYSALAGQFGQGRGALSTDYAAALKPFQANFTNAQAGQNALADALGLNGPEGNARATAAFQNNPGYQFQLGQGENAVMANAARLGQTNSGNTDIDLTKFAQGLAGTGWQNYVGNLQPYLGAANSAATGIAGVDTGLGTAMNQSYQGQGNAQYGALASIGQANAAGALAPYNASANELGAGLGLLGGAAKIGTSAVPSSSLFGRFLS